MVPTGRFIRNVHRWAAHLMVASRCCCTCARVFYTASYKAPREFNWVLGMGLLVVTLGTLLHGVPAALGPARVLGGHHRREHRSVSARADGRAGDHGLL